MTQRIRLCENSYSEKCGKYNSLPEPRTTAPHDSALTGRVPQDILHVRRSFHTTKTRSGLPSLELDSDRASYLTISNLTPQKNGRGPVSE
jgi:hypothetical protein